MSNIQTTVAGPLVSPTSPASVYFTVTSSDTVELPQSVKAVYCLAAGNLDVTDWAVTPNETTIAMAAGQQLNIRPKFVRTTSTGTFLVLLG